MSDDQGNYDGRGYRLQGYTVTDGDGRYHMEMIVPACYEPRQAQHIHVKVQGVGRPLTTQLYFSNDANRVKDRHYLPELDVQVSDAPAGWQQGTFDFVIQQYTEKDNVTPETLTAQGLTVAGQVPGRRKIAPSGGIVRHRLCGWLFQPSSSAQTCPPFPRLPPPYNDESVLNTSRHRPPVGTPTR